MTLKNSKLRSLLALTVAFLACNASVFAQTQPKNLTPDSSPLIQHLRDARVFDPNYLAAAASRDAAAAR